MNIEKFVETKKSSADFSNSNNTWWRLQITKLLIQVNCSVIHYGKHTMKNHKKRPEDISAIVTEGKNTTKTIHDTIAHNKYSRRTKGC
jgi:hypothetical protein